jgi:Tol biopolymer transport system component
MDGLSAQPLAGTEGALSPFWAPDGRRLGFIANRTLKRIDTLGGTSVVLSEDVEPFIPGAWNRDDVILFVRRDRIFRVSAAGIGEQPITTPESSTRHIWPFFLPDGRHFLYSVSPPAGLLGRAIYAGSLDSGEPKKLRDGGALPAYANGYLLFVQDNALMAQPFDSGRLEVTGEATPLGDEVQIGGGPQSSGIFGVSPTGVIAYQSGANIKSTLVWFDHAGRQQGLPSDARGFSYVDVSPNGRQLAVSVREEVDRNRDLWIYDVARGSPTRFTDEPSDDFAPVWSPDGTRIVYASNREGVAGDLDLYVRSWGEAGSDRRLLDRRGVEIPTSWSADGRFILFQTQSPNADIFRLSVSDSVVTPFANSRFSEIAGRFSPDGRWVAFVSDETGRSEVYVAPFDRAAARVPVSTEGGDSPRWRHDGKELYYARRDNTLIAVPIRSTAASIDPGAARELFQTAFVGATAPFGVGSDGRFVVIREAEDRAVAAITLIINWPAGLGKR